jgi:bacteriocin-like protein
MVPAEDVLHKPARAVMRKSSNSSGRRAESLVQAGPGATMELTETELAQVSGGGKAKTTTTTGANKSTEYLKVTMQDIFISS